MDYKSGGCGTFSFSTFRIQVCKKHFFPDGTSPMYYIDFWFPEGTHIDETSRYMKKAEEYLLKNESTKHVITFIGGAQIRFLLTYPPPSHPITALPRHSSRWMIIERFPVLSTRPKRILNKYSLRP